MVKLFGFTSVAGQSQRIIALSCIIYPFYCRAPYIARIKAVAINACIQQRNVVTSLSSCQLLVKLETVP